MKQDFKEKFRDVLEDTLKTYEHEIGLLESSPHSLTDLVKLEQFKGARHACSYLLGRLNGMRFKNETVEKKTLRTKI